MIQIEELKTAVENAVAHKETISPDQLSDLRPYVDATIQLLDQGKLRVAEQSNGQWQTNAWIKEAILFYFRLQKMETYEVGPYVYHDKIPLKRNYSELGVRVVPPATARFGSFMEQGVVLMPSYVNIGAWIGSGTMVDTWATVGSCAQIGKNVHLSGGVGIGGVLEPASATPVIVEDGAFLGSRSIVVEGVKIGAEAVLAANVTLTSSTPIIDVRNGQQPSEQRGSVPPRAVVVPGTKEKIINGAKVYTSCAYIIGERKASTDLKTSLNSVLRDFSLSV